MDLNTKKERFSLAYINAVATYANCEVIEPKVDRGSVDGILKRATMEEIIGFQAKATSRDVVGADGRHQHFHRLYAIMITSPGLGSRSS